MKRSVKNGVVLAMLIPDGMSVAGTTLARFYKGEPLAASKSGSLNYAIGPMVAARVKIGFTTNGHTGEAVDSEGVAVFTRILRAARIFPGRFLCLRPGIFHHSHLLTSIAAR